MCDARGAPLHASFVGMCARTRCLARGRETMLSLVCTRTHTYHKHPLDAFPKGMRVDAYTRVCMHVCESGVRVTHTRGCVLRQHPHDTTLPSVQHAHTTLTSLEGCVRVRVRVHTHTRTCLCLTREVGEKIPPLGHSSAQKVPHPRCQVVVYVGLECLRHSGGLASHTIVAVRCHKKHLRCHTLAVRWH